MFLIGFIVGGIVWFAFSCWCAPKILNMSFMEYCDSIEILKEAGNNRESTLSVHYDDVCQNVMVFEER